MMEFIVLLIFFSLIFYIVHEFYISHKIDSEGKESTAIIIQSKQISSNTGGSINGEFAIIFKNELGDDEAILFQETIPQLYASRVQVGDKINIKYIRKKNKKPLVSFVF